MAAPLLARVCGRVPPPAIVSTQSVIYVRFRSDGTVSHRGFRAQFVEGMWSAPVALALNCCSVAALLKENSRVKWIWDMFSMITSSIVRWRAKKSL